MATAVTRPLTGAWLSETPCESAGTVWPFGIGAGPRAVHAGPTGTRGVKVWRVVAPGLNVDWPVGMVGSDRSFLSGFTTFEVGLCVFCALLTVGAVNSPAAIMPRKAVCKKWLRSARAALRLENRNFM